MIYKWLRHSKKMLSFNTHEEFNHFQDEIYGRNHPSIDEEGTMIEKNTPHWKPLKNLPC